MLYTYVHNSILMGRNFNIFTNFQLDHQILTFQILKALQHFYMHGERHWPPVKILSIKYLKSQCPPKNCIKFIQYNICVYEI